MLVSCSDLDVVRPVLLLPLGVFRSNRGRPWYADNSVFLWIIIHGVDGFWGTVVASIFRNVLSLGVLFYLYECVRWFRCNPEHHVFGDMNSPLEDVGLDDMEQRPTTLSTNPCATRESRRFTTFECVETYANLGPRSLKLLLR